MKQILFEIPIWKENIDISKIKLKSYDFKKSFHSDITTSFNGRNILPQEGLDYLSNTFIRILSNDLKINKICLRHIWKNIYRNNYQEKHNHAGAHFSFVIYEKLFAPQTIFFHPANYLMLTAKDNHIFKTTHKLEALQNDLVIFPSYLEHMVPLVKDGLTISGNFDIELHDETSRRN